ncbi:MAG: hypothetical protein PVI30_15195 [Myxococcales bacterium]|jgi:hypothetical protein
MKRHALLPVLLLLASCATPSQSFFPGERADGVREEGHRSATYVLQGREGRFGEATLWSRGSIITLLDGAETTVIHVGFELNNTGAETLELRPEDVVLEVVHTDDGPLTDLHPHSGTTITVPSQSLGQGQAIFVLPGKIDPRDVHSFRLRWTVRAGEQRYMQRTPFLELRDRYRGGYGYAGYYGIYDMRHPYYWYYRNLGYCYDPLCQRVIIVPHRPAPVRPSGRRTRVRP